MNNVEGDQLSVLFYFWTISVSQIICFTEILKIGLNGMVFGDMRELYFQIGGNTNGGLPGKISGSLLQKDNYYSSATLVAYIYRDSFNGTITYDALDDGKPNGGSGIEIFCSGNRNPFGITLHSNGYMYDTDNGPNFGYGR
jgi:glucose/arabinose dehydrogenase